jgi:hypothetical protein
VDSGYSGTPQLKKLGIVPGARWHVVGAPQGWRFETPPDGSLETAPDSAADVVVAFVTSAAEIAPTLERLEPTVFPGGALWVAWPRKAAGHASDINDKVVREAALERSMVDTKVAAIDADLSGLKLVWRVEARR